jgi:hypothetical protein
LRRKKKRKRKKKMGSGINVPIDAPKELWMDHAIVQVEHLENGDLQISCLPENRTDERESIDLSCL